MDVALFGRNKPIENFSSFGEATTRQKENNWDVKSVVELGFAIVLIQTMNKE